MKDSNPNFGIVLIIIIIIGVGIFLFTRNNHRTAVNTNPQSTVDNTQSATTGGTGANSVTPIPGTFTLFSTPSGRYTNPVFSSSQIKVIHDVAYSNAVNVSGVNQSLTMDLYLPPDPVNTSVRPAVIVIHGGGFSAGSKTDSKIVEWALDTLADRGYVTASINYRLTKQNDDSTGPLEAVSDAQAAVRFLRAHASEYQIDTNRIAMMGSSAGAIISLFGAAADDNVGNFAALDSEVKENTSNPGYSSRICFAVSASGTIPEPLRSKILDAKDAPIVDFHGEKDTTVVYQSAVDTIDAFKALGIFADLVSYPSYGHGVPPEEVSAKSIPLFVDHLVNANCSQ